MKIKMLETVPGTLDGLDSGLKTFEKGKEYDTEKTEVYNTIKHVDDKGVVIRTEPLERKEINESLIAQFLNPGVGRSPLAIIVKGKPVTDEINKVNKRVAEKAKKEEIESKSVGPKEDK